MLPHALVGYAFSISVGLTALFGGVSTGSGDTVADPCEGIYLSVDDSHTECTATGVAMYPVYVWIWVKPDSLGVICAEFMLSYPPNVIQSQVTKNVPIISQDVGDFPSGYSVCFITCQHDWVWIAHQLVYVLDQTQSQISVLPHPDRDSVLVADCRPGYPTHGVRGGEVWLNAEAGPACAPLDLGITSGTPSVSPDTVELGQHVDFSPWTVRNNGCWETVDFSNGYYLSSDPVITSADILLDTTSTVADLGPGEDKVFPATNLTIPLNRMAGDYYIGVLADHLGTVDEVNESDNYVSTPITLTGYCTSGGGCNTYITHVEMGDIDNSSDCLGYSNYTAQSTEVLVGSANDMFVDVYSVGFGGCVKVWIDWSQDCIAQEEETTVKQFAEGGTQEITIETPAHALTGDTRMRVSAKSYDCPPVCGTVGGGETEDYTVTVVDPAGVAYKEAVDSPGAAGGYPNPFGRTTSIFFAVETQEHVRAAVYDPSGRQIAVLADRTYMPGSHPLHWDGKDANGREVSPGIYIVRIEKENEIETTKVTVLR
jgi:hypothetical protein